MTPTHQDVSPERLQAWQRLRRGRRPPADGSTESNLSGDEPGDRRRQAQADRLVRGVLRQLSLLDALLDRTELFQPDRTPVDLRWVLRLAAYEKIFQSTIPDYAIGEQAVALAGRACGPRATGFVNAVVRRLMPLLPASPKAMAADPFVASLPAATRWSVPEAIFARLAEGYGADVLDELLPGLAGEEAPIWLRVNTLRADPAALRGELAAEGVELVDPAGAAYPMPLPEALLWGGGERLPWRTAAWDRGALTVQDLGAMLAATLLDPRPGQAVLDLCAAPGGKTGHLWERMGGQGRLVAFEVDPPRRRRMKDALARLYGTDHGIETPEGGSPDALPATPLFDRVLLDVPCLGLGLIGRHPEARWDGRLGDSRRVTERQQALLESGSRRVAAGGRLLWVTCSPTRLENEEILGPWLGAHPDWALVDPATVLGADWVPLMQIRDGWVRTRPDRLPCDGFAMALLERRTGSADASAF
jgi:16S rRNA (cytosine967-C5)-methyltransferase